MLLLTNPSNDSVEAAVLLLKECGFELEEQSREGTNYIFDQFRSILQDGDIDKRIQYIIEGLFAFRKKNYEGKQGVPEELDLVDVEENIEHSISLSSDNLPLQSELDFFRFDPNFIENEEKWELAKHAILGSDDEGSDDDGNDGDDEDESDDQDKEQAEEQKGFGGSSLIVDETGTEAVNFKKIVYLTIMSSMDAEEVTHKLRQLKLKQGQEIELCRILVECCAQEKTFSRLYAIVAQNYCLLDPIFPDLFIQCFKEQYQSAHKLELNKLKNVACFFAHLLYTSSIPWTCLSFIELSEDKTTSSSRIFIRTLMQEMVEHLGREKLKERFKDPYYILSFFFLSFFFFSFFLSSFFFFPSFLFYFMGFISFV